MKTRTKESKRRLHSLILLTAFTAVLLIVSTYAWFTKQEVVSINSIRGKVEVAEGLEISLDAAKWLGSIDLGASNVSLLEQTGGSITYGTYPGHNNHVSAEFLPVSTSGETQGATEDVSPTDKDNMLMYAGNYTGTVLNDVELLIEGHDVDDDDDKLDKHTLLSPTAGFVAFDVFIKNSSKNTVSGGETLQLDSSSKAWVLKDDFEYVDKNNNSTTYQGDANSGLQNCIRVGFAKYGDAVDITSPNRIPSTESTTSILSKTESLKISKVAIWEPNADRHVQYILDNVKPLMAEKITDMSPYLTQTYGNKFLTYTLNGNAVGKTDIAVFDWDGSNDYFTETKTIQTSSKNSSGVIGSGITDLKTINSTDAAVDTIQLAPNSVTKLRLYIWIEGQDPDCVNFASYGGGVHVDLAFTKNKDQGEDQGATGALDPDTENVVGNNT